MKNTISVCLALCLAALSPKLAEADISRSCPFSIFVIHKDLPTETVAKIDTIGFCKNKFKANECRSNAYNAGKRCISDLWAARWTHSLPPSCASRLLDGGRPAARLVWQGILNLPNGQNSLKDRIEYSACCRSNSQQSPGTVIVKWEGSGGPGCGPYKHKWPKDRFYGTADISSDYGIDCDAVRKAKVCGDLTPRRGN